MLLLIKSDSRVFAGTSCIVCQAFLIALPFTKDYRRAFDNFDINKVANYSEQKQLALQSNPEIIRNKLKIRSAVTNAQAVLAIQKQYGRE
jgi:3-methyladenine DNA glycosylase Tag